MRLADYLATQREIVDARRPRPKPCRTPGCKRVGTYRCRVCGTDWCGHHGMHRLPVADKVPEALWLTAVCGPRCAKTGIDD